jgi:hypothetical protein
MVMGLFQSEFNVCPFSFVDSTCWSELAWLMNMYLPVQSSGIFSQSNFGIVTKMGMTLMPNPGGHESFVSAGYI